MSHATIRLHRPPEINTQAMLERKRLEAELFSLESQLRNFQQLREQLTASGKDATAFYRQLQARREKLIPALKAAPAVGGRPRPSTLGVTGALLSRPVAPARFDPRTGVFNFGTSGVVQVPPAMEGVNTKVGAPYPMSGEIDTVPGTPPGLVDFTGDLSVGPAEISADKFDPSINYFWVHNWNYLIPFPPPTGPSHLTYRFNVGALFSVFGDGVGNVMTFVTLGETANLTTGNPIEAQIDGGWPINADLSQPGPLYNGHYGEIFGDVTVERTFLVGASEVPAIAIVVGAIVALPMQSELRLVPFEGYSGISISSETKNGFGNLVSYSYEPQLVSHP